MLGRKNVVENKLDARKNFLINELLSVGIYKLESQHLFELSISKLEAEYRLLQLGK
ncbi:Fur-regulated basic protein FbpA [Bacillus sp. BGMRC 2118]|nr:Fur-regulated basic protein FbpA [Bacillus sp. BGMRC 2118]